MNNLNYANKYGWSDVDPYEVIRRVSDKTIEVRAMKAERDPTWQPEIIPGGFAGHCVNQNEQRWFYSSDETANTIRIRASKNGKWKDKYGNEFALAEKPRKFHDYNF